jgi:EcsC protein family
MNSCSFALVAYNCPMATDIASVTDYERRALQDMQRWRAQMLRQPGMFGWVAARVQAKVNSYIPEKAHVAITATIKHMTQAVLTGSEFIARSKNVSDW